MSNVFQLFFRNPLKSRICRFLAYNMLRPTAFLAASPAASGFFISSSMFREAA